MKLKQLVFTLVFIVLWSKSFSNYNINQKLSFTENKGQVIDDDYNLRPDILYTLNTGNGVKAYLTKKGVMYAWITPPQPSPKGREDYSDQTISENDNILQERLLQGTPLSKGEGSRVRCYHMDMELIGSNENPEVIAEDETESYTNYYLAHCPQGITHVHSYNKITYKNIYNNIDLVFYLNQENKLEYDFVARPGSNIADIQFQYKGNVDIKITENGSLEITNPLGSLTEKTPFTYLQNNRREVASQFQLNDGVVSFKVENFQSNETLVIDPTLSWGTYFGGTSADKVNDIIGDGSGNIYSTGETWSSSGISTSGSYQTSYTAYLDCFLAKFNSNGTLQWATYYGGENYDYASSITIYGTSSIYTGGSTLSDVGIATTSSFQASISGTADYNAYLSKWKTDGSLEWGTYYFPEAASYHAFGEDVCTDNSGNVYLVGFHQITDLSKDAFIVKFNSSGSRLWYASYGGSENEYCYSACTDVNSNVYLAGYTYSSSGIATSGCYQSKLLGINNGMLVKFNKNGTLQWGTYYGGTVNEFIEDVKCDASSNVYIGGYTTTSGLVTGGFQTAYGGNGDGLVAKFTSAGKLKWSSYLGGSKLEIIYGLTIDASNNIYLVGKTLSSSGVATSSAYQTTFGGQSDGLISKVTSDGQLKWTTYFGGLDEDQCLGIYVYSGSLFTYEYIAGYTYSSNAIASSNGYQSSFGGSTDGFIAKFYEATSSTVSLLPKEDNDAINELSNDGDQAISSISNFNDQIEKIKIYPNPSAGIFTIETNNNSIISVYDMIGNKVSETISNSIKTQLDLSNNKKGMYLIKIQNGDEQNIKKIVIQ